MRDKFLTAITENQAAFGLEIPAEAAEGLANFYEAVLEHNPILHLVGPCSPEEFAVRHVLESLTLLGHLRPNARFADVGAGAGLPSIPCLIVRGDLNAILIESKEKKANFLQIAAERSGIVDRVSIINRQFEEADPAGAAYVACRALDKFSQKLPRLVKWSGRKKLLLFGGPNLREGLNKLGLSFTEQLMPLSEQRFLFAVGK